MKKNRQFSFNTTPTIKARRTKFPGLSHSLLTSMNVGTLYPIYVEEVLPGDTFKVKENHVTRLTSAYLKPVMDNVYQDTYFFFCPARLYYERWAEVFGENPNGAWANLEDVKVPAIGSGEIAPGSVADYFSLPLMDDYDVADDERAISVIPYRAFADIWNYYFRDENVTDPVNIIRGERGNYERPNREVWSPTNYMGLLPKVSKFHDYFTSCLPAPQKGDPVQFELASGFLPLSATNNISNITLNGNDEVDYYAKLKFKAQNEQGGISDLTAGTYNIGIRDAYNGLSTFVRAGASSITSNSDIVITGTNLGVDSSQLPSITVNDLRYAFQLQKLLERDARGGTRLQEYILSHFGVSTPDMRMQVPEFLGGKRVPLSTQQVAQTFSSDDTLPLASVGAYSLSNGDSRFAKSFTEHGFIIGVSCLRYHHTYQQGIPKFMTRRSRLDFFDPVFSNIGEQPVWKSELYVDVAGTVEHLDDSIFGYQEAWADYRYRANKVTGQMRSGLSNTLDVWHFADNYDNAPTLSQSFIEETPVYVDRTIATDSDVQDQFIVNFWFEVEAVREMPLYSIPGLIDHH